MVEEQGRVKWVKTINTVYEEHAGQFLPVKVIEIMEDFEENGPDTQLERQLADAEHIVQVAPELVQEYLDRGYVYTNKWKGLVELTKYKQPESQSEKTPESSSSSMRLSQEASISEEIPGLEPSPPSSHKDSAEEAPVNLKEKAEKTHHTEAKKSEPEVISPRPEIPEPQKEASANLQEAIENVEVKVIDHSFDEDHPFAGLEGSHICPLEAGEEHCLIDRGPGFDAIRAMTACQGCGKYEAWLSKGEVEG